MNLEFKTTFVVMPAHCNYMFPMVFGGHFFSEMDLCAASAVSRLLHDSICDSAVTHKFSGTFFDAAMCGDLIFLEAKITELRNKAVKVKVEAYREKRAESWRDHIAEAEFVFVTKKDGEFRSHGLKL